MKKHSVAKVQHYVPQFLLRNFGIGKKDKLNVFDKKTDRQFATNTKNVAAESHFYDVELQGHVYSMEPSLSKVEAAAKPVMESILRADTIVHLTPEQRAILCAFLAIQFTRTRSFREQMRHLPRLLGEHLRKHLGETADLSGVAEHIREPSENELTLMASEFMQKAPTDFGIHFANKSWVLLATSAKCPFWIGDNPITMFNSIDMGPFGNIGLAVTGIEIYMPLSPRRALGFWCPSLAKTLRTAASHQKDLNTQFPDLNAGAPSYVAEILTAIDSGTPLEYRPENVTHFNSLQVQYAERYVFAHGEDFSLLKEMVSTNPHLRNGPRPTTN